MISMVPSLTPRMTKKDFFSGLVPVLPPCFTVFHGSIQEGG